MNNPNENTQQTTQTVTQPVLEMSAHIADLHHQATALKVLKGKKGPSTPEAKQRVKYNALRHGFTGQVLIVTPEEREHFDAFLEGMMTDLAPAGTHETFLANSIAEEAWRLNQIRARCINLSAVADFDGAGDKYRPMVDQQVETDAIEDAVIETVIARDQSKHLALMSLYAQRTQRAYEKYRKQLTELQEKRKADRAAQLEEARLLFQLADSQGLAYEPKKDGFVFSPQFIRTQAERHHRLILAKRTEGDYRKKNNLTEITRTAGKAA
jgi:hypothetical protein